MFEGSQHLVPFQISRGITTSQEGRNLNKNILVPIPVPYIVHPTLPDCGAKK